MSSQQSNGSAIPETETEWRAVLSPEQFRVLRQKGTEAPGTGEYNKHKESVTFFWNLHFLAVCGRSVALGVYSCAGCHAPLYKSTTKFDSGCGWPAFFDAIPNAVNRHTDDSLGMSRIEITCAKCGGHLGHVFKGEGFPTPTNERHCVNSISLSFNNDPNVK
ncbi:Peptide methionine sulfoxide reductase B2, chloroplastic [Mycoemilia scoparia]|uniref:Peptide methionine sulfoxide reductase B2, chloroplastic n=1 Tax=Mycoemilia scoparia TaxID=417184 RepID=A0A9W8A6V2_9FUNG|nr:Peptide methionine sulfoxide reductase B2, chloroplastic [Mycoemilia scoparia]